MEQNRIEKLEKDLCSQNVPSGFNLYKWCKENSDTAIAHSVKRLEKIFDQSDEVFFGFSGGKDSTLAAELAVLELKRRWARVESRVDRHGENRVDPLDEKWIGKKLWGNSMDSEWIFSDTYNYIAKFVRERGPLGDNTVNMFYKALRLGWQSGVSFGESRLTSWDKEKEDMWIRPMPGKKELGIDVVTNDNLKTVNPVPLESLPKEWQEKRLKESDYFEVGGRKMVANYGLGAHDLDLKGYESVKFTGWTFENQDEDDEQDTFTRWVLESVPEGTILTNLIALRSAESFDRYTILKQADYSTGQYASSKI